MSYSCAKRCKGSLTGSNKLVLVVNKEKNKDQLYLTGASLSAPDLQLGSWKLQNIQASFNESSNTFSGSAILKTQSAESIGVSLLFDSNGLKDADSRMKCNT